MALYDLNQTGLEQLYAGLNLAAGVVNTIDTVLTNSGNMPTGKLLLPVQTNSGSGNETISLSDSIGLFIETGQAADTISFSPSSSGGHVLVAGDANGASLLDTGGIGDTLIAGYDFSSVTHQTLTVESGNNLLLGGLYSTASDVLNAGSGNDTLQVYSGQNTLNAGSGHDTLDGGSGMDVMNLGGPGSRDVVNSGSGAETINLGYTPSGSGGHDTVNAYSAGETNVYINQDSASVTETHNVGGTYDQFSYKIGGTTTTVDITSGSATVHFLNGTTPS